jgi:8-oxo-dGTP diphosphatase
MNRAIAVNGLLPGSFKVVETLMIVVAAALIDRAGRVLLQQRAPGRQMAGLWEFPGGKVEAGELPEEALARELEEELGISAEIGSFTALAFASEAVAGRHMILLLYTCRSWSGEPQALDASALKWVRPQEMEALEMPPADKPLIRALEALL